MSSPTLPDGRPKNGTIPPTIDPWARVAAAAERAADASERWAEARAGSTAHSVVIVVAATRMHDALFHDPELLRTLPPSIRQAYGDLQCALRGERR